MRTLELAKRAGAHSLYVGPGITVHIWSGNVLPEDYRAACNEGLRWMKSADTQLVQLMVVSDKVGVPGDALREEARRLLPSMEPYLLASAVALETAGFAGAAVRAAMSGMSLMLRAKYPMKIFQSVEDSAAWLVPQMPLLRVPSDRWTVPDLSRALRTARDAAMAR